MVGDLRLTGKCHIHYNCNNVDATFRRCKPIQLCTFVSYCYKRNSSGNDHDFLFRVSVVQEVEMLVGFIHTPWVKSPDDTFQGLQFGYVI